MCQATNIHDQYHTTNEHTDIKRRKYAHIYALRKFSPGIKTCTPHAQTLKLIHGNASCSHNRQYTLYTLIHLKYTLYGYVKPIHFVNYPKLSQKQVTKFAKYSAHPRKERLLLGANWEGEDPLSLSRSKFMSVNLIISRALLYFGMHKEEHPSNLRDIIPGCDETGRL